MSGRGPPLNYKNGKGGAEQVNYSFCNLVLGMLRGGLQEKQGEKKGSPTDRLYRIQGGGSRSIPNHPGVVKDDKMGEGITKGEDRKKVVGLLVRNHPGEKPNNTWGQALGRKWRRR